MELRRWCCSAPPGCPWTATCVPEEHPRIGAAEPSADSGSASAALLQDQQRTKAEPVPRVVVDVMPKPEILDPQGQAVLLALRRLGQADAVGLTEIRQGKRFTLDLDGTVTDDALARIAAIATEVLSNPVIEDVVSVRVLDGEGD